MKIKIFNYFICGALVFTLSACATTKNSNNSFSILDIMGVKELSQKTLAAFASKIRPVRGNPDSHYMLARFYQERGKHQEAIAEFEKTLAIEPGHIKALNAMGVSYDFLMDFPRAFECYQAALVLDPDSANIYYNNMGQSMLLQGRYIPSIEAFKMAAAYDEDFPDARVHKNLGRAYAMFGHYDLALAEFELVDGDESAEALLNRVLAGIEKQPPASGIAVAAAGNETKDFSARVSSYLRDKRVAGNVHLARLEASRQESTGAKDMK